MRKQVSILMTLLLFSSIVVAQNIGNCGTDTWSLEDRNRNPAQYNASTESFEAGLREQISLHWNSSRTKTAPKVIIPVVFHVFHNNGPENLTDDQINRIIINLNMYYSADSVMVSVVRPIFKDIIANTNVEFRLARNDPQGNFTDGIVRVHTLQTYTATEEIKKLSVWDTKRYLNIWSASTVYANGNVVGGYAQFPWSSSGSATDGVLLDAQQSLAGNTVAHEIAHYMGLYHTFEGGDVDSCSDGDGVSDTPPTYFIPVPGGPISTGRNKCTDPTYNSCSSDNPDLPDQQENIMDYFDGPCSGVMFTLGQLERMQFCLTSYRFELWQESNLERTGVSDGSTGTNRTEPYQLKYTVVPNPFQSRATIQYELPQPYHAKIVLYNIVGKQITLLYNGDQDAGKQSIVIDKNEWGLSNGIYIVQAVIGNSSFGYRIVIN